jgi:hypothetical protein
MRFRSPLSTKSLLEIKGGLAVPFVCRLIQTQIANANEPTISNFVGRKCQRCPLISLSYTLNCFHQLFQRLQINLAVSFGVNINGSTSSNVSADV